MVRRYTAGEICDITGISRSTLKYYRKRRIISAPLPPAYGTLNRQHARWTENHIREIREALELLRNRPTLYSLIKDTAEEDAWT